MASISDLKRNFKESQRREEDYLSSDEPGLLIQFEPKLDELINMVQRRNPMAESNLVKLKNTFYSSGYRDEFDRLENTLRSFDFKTALSILQHLKTNLGHQQTKE